jgi:hypothetical protein
VRIAGEVMDRPSGWVVFPLLIIAWVVFVTFGSLVTSSPTYERKRIQGVDCIVGHQTNRTGIALTCDWSPAEPK